MEAEWIDLPTASVDGVLCRFGYMLLADPEASLRETRRVLRRGGRVALAAWTAGDDNPWMTSITRTLVEHGPRRARRRPASPARWRSPSPARSSACSRTPASRTSLVEPLDFTFRFDSTDAHFEHQREMSHAPARRSSRRSAPPSTTALRDAIDDEARAVRRRADGSGRDPRAAPGSRRPSPERLAPARFGRHVLRQRRRPRASSTARPSPSSATARRATPTPRTSRTPASTSSSACVPDSKSVEQAKADGLRVEGVADAASSGDIVMVLVPDELHHDVWESDVRDGIAEGNILMFGHGFSVHYGEVEPPAGVDVALVAPKGPGHLVRRQYLEGSGVPGLIAIHQDATGNAKALALAYAKGIGCTRGGVIETTFKDETETDLFGEQAVLCGGASELVQAGLRDARRGRLRPADGVLRVPARAQAHRRPHVREGPGGHALLDLQHRRVRRLHPRQARHHRRDAPEDEEDPRARSRTATSPASGSPRTARARRTSSACAPSRPRRQIETTGKELRSKMDWIKTEFVEPRR